MHKKLVSYTRLSCFMALATTSALVQAQSVSISGAMDVSYESVNTGDPGGRKTQLNSGTVTSSRIVFSGEEDLGGGLGAFFRLDMGIQADNGNLLPGANGTFGRTSIAGLSSREWGQLSVGRTVTPLTPMLVQTDFGAVGYYGNSGSISQNLIGRTSNGMFYTSPSMGGFIVRAAYGLGLENGVAPKDEGHFKAIGVQYNNAGLTINGAYQTDRERIATGTNTATDNASESGIGAKYDFGQFAVNGGVYRIHQVAPSASREPAAISNNTKSSWLGVAIKLTAEDTLGFQVGKTDGDLERAGLPKPESKTIATYLRHNLSKRTYLYANYAWVNNNSASKVSLIPAAYSSRIRPNINGSDPSATALGLVHTF
jgi:predicted porin